MDFDICHDDYTEGIHEANKLLLYRKFDECLYLCNKTITTAKGFMERKGSAEAIECLSLVAVQAYAELNRWQEVLPFVTQLYDGIEDCPPKLVEICVLLHAHMHDYTTCNAVSHIWLRNPSNSTCPDYSRVVEIFLTKIMEPQGRLADAKVFLESCPGLSEDQRTFYKRYAEEQMKALTSTEDETDDEGNHQSTLEARILSNKYSMSPEQASPGFVQRMVQTLTKYVPPHTQSIIKRIALIAIFFYWLLTKANFDVLSNERLLSIISAMVRLWRSMFAPYHLVK